MEGMLSSLLSDPEKLQQAISVASSFLGGEQENQQNNSVNVDFEDPSLMLMQKAMPVISQIAQSGQSAVSYEKRQLF